MQHSSPHTSPRVLIICDNASLKMGGESARPVHYFRTLRKRSVDVRLCVHERCRNELRTLLGDDFDRVTFAPDTWMHKLLWRFGKPFPHQFKISTFGAAGHLLTQRWQRKTGKKLVTEHKIDVVHQPIPISPKQPSALHSFGVPVVIGPLNGDINYPPAFAYMESRLVRWSVGVGRFAGHIANFFIPGKRRAAIILVSNERTANALPAGVRGKVIRLVANAVDLSTWDAPTSARSRAEGAQPRFAFLGRLVDFKMVDLLLEAFSPVAWKYNAHLDIVGEGQDRAKLEAIAKHLNLTEHVTFHGWQNYKDSATILGKADALVFPSLRECGGAVVMEAMAVGLPVIASDWGGPADYVGNDGAGVLVKPDTKASFVQGLTDEMSKLAASPELVTQMSERARQRAVSQFQWDTRVDALLDIYKQAVA